MNGLNMQNLSKPHRTHKALWAALTVLGLALVGPLGCSGEDDSLPNMGGTGDRGGAGVLSGPCEDGQKHHCSETIDQANGQLTCWEGTQYCENGRWSACIDGELSTHPDPTAEQNRSFIRPQAISTAPVSCINNPCDPTCMWWAEDPNPDLIPPIVVVGDPTYTGLPTASVCSHDLCTTGAALDITCSACVQTVCSNTSYASCCDASVPDAWNQTCVNAAYTLCINQPPPFGLCDFGLYSTGAVVGADRASSGAPIGSNTSVTLGVDANPSRVVVNGNLTIANGNGSPLVAPNGIIATGNVSVAAGNGKITGNVQAGGSVTINSGVAVTGNVWAGTTIGGQNTGTINGTGYAGTTIDPVLTVSTRVENSTHAAPVVTLPTSIPSKTVTCSTNAADNRSVSSGTLSLPPGNYNSVSVSNDGTLVLSAEGNYTFNSLSVNTGKIQLGAAFTTVGYNLDICGSFTLKGQSSYNEIQDSTGALLTTPAALRIYVNGSGTAADIGTNVQFVGVLRAPNGAVNKGDNGSIRGAIWSGSMSLGTDQKAVGLTQAECDSLNISGTGPATVTCGSYNTAPAVPSAKNEPCNTGLDCQMNSRCVEPRTVGGAHSKCLEGAALSASQGDACVTKICAADPSCCSTYWSPACVAKVATVCDAVCGTPTGCLHGACTEGSALQTSCNSCINTICSNAATAYCCTTAWDATCVAAAYAQCNGGLTADAVTPGVSICDYAAYSTGNGTVTSSVGAGAESTVKGGKLGSAGTLNLSYTNVLSDALSVNAFNFPNAANVTGYALQETNSAPTNPGNLSGTSGTPSGVRYPTQLPRPTLPTVPGGFSCPGGGTLPTNGNGSIAPGNYGALSVTAGSTLTLTQAGTYTFSSIDMNAQSGTAVATLALPATGNVIIKVCGTVYFRRGAKMTGLTDTTALNLALYASGAIDLESGTTLYGLMYTTSTAAIGLHISDESTGTNGTTLKGMAVSTGTLRLSSRSTIDYANLRSSCIAKGYGSDPTATSPERLCAYSAYGTTSVATTNGTTFFKGGDVGSKGTVSLGNGTGSRTNVHGSVHARGNVTLNNAAVLGDVRTTGTITQVNSPLVYGTLTPPGTSVVPNPTAIPSVSFTCGSTAKNFDGTSGTLAPGVYGALTMANNANVTLSAGSYYFSSVSLNSNAKFTFPASPDVVKFYVCGQAWFGSGTAPSGLSLTSGSDWLRFQVYSSSTNSTLATPAIKVETGSTASPVYGVMIAPNGMVGVGNSSKLNGLAWGKYVELDTGAQIDSTGVTGTACVTSAIDSQPTCPVTLTAPTPPSETALCTANATGATGYKDATCPGFDLALGTVCSTQVPVCNHGTTGYTGPLDVYYFAYTDRQMSTPTPLLSAKDGVCSTASITIPAGYCTNLPCSLPTASAAAPYTFIVGPTTGASALNECDSTNKRNLDNWGVYDGRSCSTGGDLTRVEAYAATCSAPGTSPRWGQFTWDADVPGSSTIEFWARTGDNATAASAAGYTLIKTVTTAEQNCGLGCPVDLTTALSLNKYNQDPYMDLKMVLKSSGTNRPTLRDWKVRYTCPYDE